MRNVLVLGWTKQHQSRPLKVTKQEGRFNEEVGVYEKMRCSMRREETYKSLQQVSSLRPSLRMPIWISACRKFQVVGQLEQHREPAGTIISRLRGRLKYTPPHILLKLRVASV